MEIRKYNYMMPGGRELYVQKRKYGDTYYIFNMEYTPEFEDAESAQTYLDIYCKSGERYPYA